MKLVMKRTALYITEGILTAVLLSSGVASDMDGAFELLLPGAYADKKLRVSVVGYAPYDFLLHHIGNGAL